MIERCTSPTAKGYAKYGGAGIKVCDKWLDFAAFLEDMGPRPAGTTIDRKDNAKGYEPGNCRWATKRVQTQNRSIARMITHQGITLNMVEWARKVGMKPSTLNQRINGYKWDVDRALTQPVKARG